MTQTIIKVPAAGAFDPTDIELTDNTSGAFLIKEGSNEYMRINTTDGLERFQISLPTASNNYITAQKLSATSQYIQLRGGAYMQIYMNQVGGSYTTEVQGTTVKDVLVSPGFAGKKQIVASTGSVVIQEVDTDTNFTHTLDSGNSAVFKVQDDAGTPTEFLKIDSDTSASLIEFNVPANQGAGMTVNLPADSGSNTGFQLLTPSGHIKFGRQASGIYTGGTGLLVDVGAGKQLTMTGAQYRFTTSTTPIVFNLNDASGGSLQITDAADATILEVKEDSSLAHILDSGSSATFEVKHDAMTTTYNQFFKAQEGVGTIITPGDGNTIQICNASTAANSSERIILTLYQNNFLEQYQLPKWYTGTKQTTSSAASSTLTYDVRLGRSESQGHMRTLISSTYSGTHAFTANFTNTLSAFAGNQNWGVTSQIHRFENTNTSNGATLQFGVVTGGTVKFINNSGITTGITDPVSGTQALAAKGSAVAGTYSLLVYRLTQFNTLQGSASLYDDDRYIIELLYAELI